MVFFDVIDCDVVELMYGIEVYVLCSVLLFLKVDEYYWVDLEGL